MRKCVILAAVALLTANTSAFANDKPIAPVTGSYIGGVYVATSDSGCLDKSGVGYFAEVSFDGLGGSTDYIRLPLVGSPGAIISGLTLTVKTGKGTTNLGGDLVWTGTGIGASWNVTGTFTTTITEVGARALVMQLNLSYTNCSAEDWNVSLARVGAYQ